jgi:cytokinesis protein
MEEEGVEEGEGADKGKGILSPTSETNESVDSNIVTSSTDTPDVADRAAAMLEGLQTGGLNKDGSLSVRRRRESADTERERRRRRRQQASSAKSEEGGLMSPTIPEEGEERRGSVFSADGVEEPQPGTPIIGVMPPSPEGGKRDREGEGEREDLPSPPPEWS